MYLVANCLADKITVNPMSNLKIALRIREP